jgi:hypothetical protein
MTRGTALLDFLVQLHGLGVQAVRHGRWVALRGEALSRVPAAVWRQLRRLQPVLRRHVRQEPSPFRQRERRGLTEGRAEA